MLATAAMVLRNAVLLGILAPTVLVVSVVPLALMCALSLVLAFLLGRFATTDVRESEMPTLQLASPFSLRSALKFGILFLVLQVGGTIAQVGLGQIGFYGVSLVGGLVSSASAVASAGTLAAHATIPVAAASMGAVLASFASVLINLPLIARLAADRGLTRRLAWALASTVVLGGVGVVLQVLVLNPMVRAFVW
jgi:uncharacterized membrane protein (DUF4010 family)